MENTLCDFPEFDNNMVEMKLELGYNTNNTLSGQHFLSGFESQPSCGMERGLKNNFSILCLRNACKTCMKVCRLWKGHGY